jgi:hypothetical protein
MSRRHALLGDIPCGREKNSRALVEKHAGIKMPISKSLTQAGTQRDGFAPEAFELAEMFIDGTEYGNPVRLQIDVDRRDARYQPTRRHWMPNRFERAGCPGQRCRARFSHRYQAH